ncbi:hypothetical protein HMPREF0620_0371 [Parascardovia denticolens DSM 10105 = JCM 12538]|uniref:Uncharacterized protein n=1 Tax=Parascardovia denticolens DSM 10105 = JCM 12538 TaxID=864564 RepID=E6K0M8_PARDN|nr:hypothetical protein HMPREF0620_0371 [Parascardovia denticolens DSM 10105 = JCM 12538]
MDIQEGRSSSASRWKKTLANPFPQAGPGLIHPWQGQGNRYNPRVKTLRGSQDGRQRNRNREDFQTQPG